MSEITLLDIVSMTAFCVIIHLAIILLRFLVARLAGLRGLKNRLGSISLGIVVTANCLLVFAALLPKDVGDVLLMNFVAAALTMVVLHLIGLVFLEARPTDR